MDDGRRTTDDGRCGRCADLSSIVYRLSSGLKSHIWLVAVFVIALGLRLLVWRWHAPYDLGGDEREYFNQALTLLREHRYVELRLMRPPLYTGFLAACIYLLDSLVQRLRLVQAIVGALTVVPVYLLARRLVGARRVALGAALLVALDYTLAASATELLTETLFVFGLATFFWLLLEATDDGPFDSAQGGRRTTNEARAQGAGRRSQDPRPKTQDPRPKTQVPGPRSQATASPGHLVILSSCHLAAALAGLNLGALALLRSVALALLPLGVLWLMLRRPTNPGLRNPDEGRGRDEGDERRSIFGRRDKSLQPPASGLQPPARWSLALCFVLAAALVVAPWTLRNYRTYGALILVDTTGAENLWLDNNPAGSAPDDPLGREAAKRALYALGDDRAARQRLGTRQGVAAIASNPGWFLAKAWGEAKKFFALQFFDDMRDRRAIWVPPLEVWLRLLLGDGMWLVLLLAGTAGLWLAPTDDGPFDSAQGRRRMTDAAGPQVAGRRSQKDDPRRLVAPSPLRRVGANGWRSSVRDPRWLLVPWALYTFLTALLFHVELRYRLPLYPVLAPYAAWALAQVAGRRSQVAGRRSQSIVTPSPRHPVTLSAVGAAMTCLALIGITLLHRPYARETWMLARKHAQLWRADRALAGGDAP
ncbi:MAG TPA: glycosyltransferase family 39 protein, partial [Roseiflexaceae bacterium]